MPAVAVPDDAAEQLIPDIEATGGGLEVPAFLQDKQRIASENATTRDLIRQTIDEVNDKYTYCV